MDAVPKSSAMNDARPVEAAMISGMALRSATGTAGSSSFRVWRISGAVPSGSVPSARG
jgi:hypothetical protein